MVTRCRSVQTRKSAVRGGRPDLSRGVDVVGKIPIAVVPETLPNGVVIKRTCPPNPCTSSRTPSAQAHEQLLPRAVERIMWLVVTQQLPLWRFDCLMECGEIVEPELRPTRRGSDPRSHKH